MRNFLVQRGMVCSSKLTNASSLRSKCHGKVRRQKASTSCQHKCRRQAPTVCRDGQRRPPQSAAKPRGSISPRWKTRSTPATKEKMLVNRPCRKEPYSSAKHCSAVANQSKACGIKRNAPAYWVRVEKKGEATAPRLRFRSGAARRRRDPRLAWGLLLQLAWRDRDQTSCKSGARPR